MFGYMSFKRVSGKKTTGKDDMWETLIRHGALLDMPAAGGGPSDRMYPILGVERAVRDVFPIMREGEDMDDQPQDVYPERLHVRALYDRHYNSRRLYNVDVYKSAVKTVKSNAGRSGGGGKKKGAQAQPKAAQKEKADQTQPAQLFNSYNKLCTSEANTEKLLNDLATHDSHGKRRRTAQKSAQDYGERYTVPEVASLESKYQYTIAGIRTRRQLVGMGSQKLSRAQLMVALPQTVDLDIENCGFTLLHQMVEKVNPRLMPTTDRGLLERCANDRESLCREMGVDLNIGKTALMSVLNGKVVRDEERGAGTLRRIARIGRCLRWISWEALRDVHRRLVDDKTRPNPDTGMLFHMWSAVEDLILEKWVAYIKQKLDVKHLSLHFDGIRVQLPPETDVGVLCGQCSYHIHQETGFRVTIHSSKSAFIRNGYDPCGLAERRTSR